MENQRSIRDALENATTIKSELERAKDLLVERKKNLSAKLTAAYAPDFLLAAAVFYEQDAQLYHGLRSDLKGRGVTISDWENRVRQIVRKRAAERAAADKAVGGTAAASIAHRESVATQLVNLVTDVGVALFHDDEDECFATTQVGGHEETHPLESTAFRRWLIRLYDTNFKSAPNARAIIDARATLASRAYHDGPCRNVATRVGEQGGCIFIDLGDPAWSIVKVQAQNDPRTRGWQLIPYADCPIRFRRPRGTKSIPVPVAGGSIGLLRKFVNATDEEWPLVLACLVQALRGCGPYPVLVLRGEHGSGKTTLAKVFKELTDPRGVNIRSAPRETRDIVAATRNAHTLVFDNLSKIPAEISDGICALSTGGGFGGRALYTDNDEATFTACRPVILTSITEVVTHADLLDRSVIVSPPLFATGMVATDAEACREAEKQFWAGFAKVSPLIFGAVLDALAYGLAHVDTVRLEETTRMLDFAIWASACLAAFGIEQQTFLDAYRDNRAGANEAALEASLISPYVQDLAKNGWSGAAAGLLEEVKMLAGDKAKATARQLIDPLSGRV